MFELLFDKDFYNFNRSVKDMRPYQIKRYEDYMILVHNIVGIEEKDLKIEIIPERNTAYLEIKGETKNEILDSTYSVNSRFSIDKEETKNIKYEVKDGLLYVYIYYKEPDKLDIEITKK